MIREDIEFILGSASPRRQELLQRLELEFRVLVSQVEEKHPSDRPCREIPEYLARLKTTDLAGDIGPGELLITADTVVVLDDRIIEKPSDAAHAREMLMELSGRSHEVYSGVCLTWQGGQHSFSERTLVHFDTMDQREVEHYVEKYQPFDKAGSYGIQEWIGYIRVRGIEGCYYNVMGLPLHRLYVELLLVQDDIQGPSQH